jgi:acetyl-CoA acetyltransferase
MERIRITGIGDSQDGTDSLEGIIFSAARGALADGGLERSDLDGVVIAASDQVDGRAISSMLTSGPAGAYLNEEINVASSPGHAVALACMQIASGTHRRLLVTSWGKASESEGGSTEGAERLSTEPFFERDGGLSRIAAAGIQADAHRRRGGDPDRADRAAATVAARNHRPQVSVEDVLGSAPVAAPLRDLECPAETDGAYSLLLEAEQRDGTDAVAVEGFGWCADSGRIAERDLVGVPHLRLAAAAAYGLAGIDDPGVEIGAWELHDYSPDAEIVAYSALGLCPPGAAIERALAGWGGGSPFVNPLGGSLAGEAPFGGPMRKLLSAVRHLRGDSVGQGLPAVERVGVQISSGFAGQFQSAFVLGQAA